MSVYHEFKINVESEHREKPDDGMIISLSRDGNGGLAFNVFTNHLRNRQEWREVRDALNLAGQQLGWY